MIITGSRSRKLSGVFLKGDDAEEMASEDLKGDLSTLDLDILLAGVETIEAEAATMLSSLKTIVLKKFN